MLEVMGKERVLSRFDRAIERFSKLAISASAETISVKTGQKVAS
jgi:hypothetical protein